MTNSDIAALGKQIRSARKKADLTQVQLDAVCPVDTHHIANIENGIINPTYESDMTICRILPVSKDARILTQTNECYCNLRDLRTQD